MTAHTSIATTEAAHDIKAYLAAKNPNPIRDAHTNMVTRLAGIIPPRLYATNDPADFDAVSEYLLAVGRIVDECILSVGKEVKSSASVNVDIANFTDQLTDQLLGFAVYDVNREVASLKQERAA